MKNNTILTSAASEKIFAMWVVSTKMKEGHGKLLIELIGNGSCIGDALPNLTKKNRMLRTASVSFSIDSF